MNAFVFYNTHETKRHNEKYHTLRAFAALFVFELETKLLSEVRLDFPPNRAYYQFHLDSNFILNIITYEQVTDTLDNPTQLRTALMRIPLKRPDNLLNLCRIQIKCPVLFKVNE